MIHQPKSEFLRVMKARGFLHDCTDIEGLDEALMVGGVPAYIGFDATAPSLHVGSLIQIMMLRWLQKTGHRPIVLMGGGTSKIGDPSFRPDERQLISDETIRANIAGIQRIFERYIDLSDAIMANNEEWLGELKYINFLREIGKYFSINRMLGFESVKSRLDRDRNLSFLEFNYMILQAYDFMELNRRYGCLLQMGGSDQWGNIVNGIDLARRMNDATVFGLTSPLLTKADGSKMGKSASGAIWLNGDSLGAYEFWQFWRNTSDADVGRFLKLYTELPMDEVARLELLEDREINEAKVVLANEVTAMCHGRPAAQAAEAAARETFERGGASADLPTLTLAPDDFADNGISIGQLFVRSGLVESGKAARRLVSDGGARLNDKPVSDPGLTIVREQMATPLKLSAGRKRHVLVKLG